MTAPTPADINTAAPEAAPNAPEAPAPETPATPEVPEFKAITSQDEFDKIFGARFAKEKAKFADYEDLKNKASQFEELENSKKSDLDRANEELSKLREQIAAADAEKLRNKVAQDAGIPAAWAARLRGDTEEELQADAAELAESLPKPAPQPKVPSPKPEPTGGGATPKEDSAGFDPAAIAAKLAGRF